MLRSTHRLDDLTEYEVKYIFVVFEVPACPDCEHAAKLHDDSQGVTCLNCGSVFLKSENTDALGRFIWFRGSDSNPFNVSII